MRIGIVTSWFERGAAYVSRQYMEQLRSEHQVFIYSRGGEREAKGDPAWDQDFVTWGSRPLIDESSAVDLEDFSRWLDSRKIECVFFNEQRSWPAVTLCARRKILNGAYVVHYREDTIPFFDCHDFLICNSRHHHEVFQNHAQAVFLPWGTDLQRFQPRGTDLVHPGRVTFFHSGGMNPHRKGTDLVLEAFARLHPTTVQPHLVLHTQVDFERDLPAGGKWLRELQQRGLVTLIDKTVPDLAELYRMGDVCVYPTRHEGLGLTIAESLASGLPILVTDQAPVSEHADGQVVRTLAVERRYARPDGDYWPQTFVSVGALAQEMQRLVDEHEQLPELRRQARIKAAAVTDWSKNARELAGQFSQFRRIDSARKNAAVEAAEQFERGKWRLGLRNWIGSSFPGIVRGTRRLGALRG
jgi:glycosyltransferase involved in cell wall biosynthesis